MALNPLVSLFGRLVVRSGRKHGNRHTHTQTNRRSTVTLAAHAPRVNYKTVNKCTFLCLRGTCNSKSMPTRALSGIHEVILRNPEGAARGLT